jgi:hypothetical protein
VQEVPKVDSHLVLDLLDDLERTHDLEVEGHTQVRAIASNFVRGSQDGATFWGKDPIAVEDPEPLEVDDARVASLPRPAVRDREQRWEVFRVVPEDEPRVIQEAEGQPNVGLAAFAQW